MHRGASRSSLDTAASWSRPSLLISPSTAGTESGISSPPTSEDGDNEHVDERKLMGGLASASTTTSPYSRDDFGIISPFASPTVSPPRRASFHFDDVASRRDMADLAVAAEEGSLVGARAGLHVPKIKTNFRDSDSSAQMGAASGRRAQRHDRTDLSWSGLYARAQDMAGRWRHIYANEGLPGVAHNLQSGPLAYVKANVASSRPFASIRNLVAVIPPRRRALLLAMVSIISLFLLLAPADGIASSRRGGLFRRRGGSAAKALAILQSSTSALALVPENYPKSANKAKMLESVSNPYGYMNLIDPYTGGAFNPSILVLPDQAGLGWRHVFVSRGEEKYEVINGEDTRWEKLLGCFLLPMKRAHLELPYLARESELWTLDLPAKRKVDYMRCHNKDFDQFIGPEDPRLFFTDDGQPLLIYSQNGRIPNVCRALYIIDARMVIPGLDKALQRAGWNAPVQFREQTDLIRENQFNIEKNWSPFLGENDDLFFHVSLVPQQVYKYVPNLTLRPLDPLAPAHNCLTDLLGADMNRVHVHHATPLLRATLCKRGECVPDTSNTVMFGMVHVKYHPLPYLHYVRHIVTWNTTAPYEYLSVSKPLTYSGTNQADPIFTTSMAWDKPSKRHGLGLNHGFLDDTVLISFGVADYGSAYIDVRARDLLTDHNLCSGVQGTSLWRGSA